eukprot:CAMPEP_0174349782 /NCGR_PEP_ID=MMETSP0811_2-20130205/6609_1 /TAXON_ID=73025 ORGANISM="Eutreptiella gymnastica-like, Strain CCMP1594" /NCGR_SAMPLE_ID=MMETSP0811_2 /ASSEMBLY_ACC=CAM_ASM_000667 /LENGTH=73 /DNA_ID=CAMNT_0015477437 /DNA_START=112 /DNA_END=333 /DNA_ORIENTATION=+
MQTFQAEPHMPSTLDVSKQIDFSVASPVAAPLDSQKAADILQSVQLEMFSDPDTDCTDSGIDSGASDAASTIS